MSEPHPDDRPAVDPDRPCPHENFWCDAAVARITKEDDGPVGGFAVELTARCVDCSEPFKFRGPLGLSPAHPTVSFDGLTLTAPMHPASGPEEFGLDLPGFTVRATFGAALPDEGEQR